MWRHAALLGSAVLSLVLTAACDPVIGTGAGNPPDLTRYITIDSSSRTVVITLVAGYPAGDYEFNYDGYTSGALVVTVPVGWQATIQCENRSTVPNSCAVVAGRGDTRPLDPAWSTPEPQRGLDPGQTAGFQFDPTSPGSWRIASLVAGSEASGMWADLEVTSSGMPSLQAPGS